MEGSADTLSTRNQRYGLDAHPSAEAGEELLQSLNGVDSSGPTKHMSAHERRLQKKKVEPKSFWPTSFYLKREMRV